MEDGIPGAGAEAEPQAAGLKPLSGSAASLHEEILTSVRGYLLEGSLPEGARIPERLLCEQMGVSRTPLREALKVLASEGLVELLPNRGARVRSYDKDDIRELFEVMGGLEALAGRLACAGITDAEVGEIERLHYDMYSCYMRRDLPAYFDLNQKIHGAIVAAARNELLAATHANFASRIQRVRYNANRENHRDRWGEAMREHEQMLDALQRRSGSELADIMYAHLQNKRAAAMRYLDEGSEA
ncbi:GntR family transcriptional regulator [Pelagovum pacificum]|uniref:GntR family transcriptional regulator n=1 Tax=Pelagovum pacificum TaxID=2588711 RepID=A0A5C5GEU8_9RHOB|nr:GntR family transcriptional regulator [Pelagovum pacificum]QQA44302.1 GntR family transcriptional regulator [Pelagovum pacificum]TNY32577.1 GntR family transcriptional regulator [Pelagovum pacificum]